MKFCILAFREANWSIISVKSMPLEMALSTDIIASPFNRYVKHSCQSRLPVTTNSIGTCTVLW